MVDRPRARPSVRADGEGECGGEGGAGPHDGRTAIGECRGGRRHRLDARHASLRGREYPFMQLYSPAATAGGVACIEPMTAATSALTDAGAPLVQAGASMRANFTTSVTIG